MMKLINTFLIVNFVILFTIVSCKKEDEAPPTESTTPIVKIPKAEFEVSTTSLNLFNYGANEVKFTNNSENNPTAYCWSFGDGSFSNYKEPYHAYEQAGTYTVSLIAYNSAGSDTMVKENLITVKAIEYETGEFTDNRDGKQYKTVKLFGQEWMAENLAYKVDTGGCWAYNNDENNVNTFGYLYTWDLAQIVAPEGWHLPTIEEWRQFTDSLNEKYGSNYANELTSNLYWNTYEYYGGLNPNNYSGFSGLPAGCRYSSGEFNFINNRTFWWTASEYEGYNSYTCTIHYESNSVSITYYDKTNAYSIRCIKNSK